MHKITQKTFYKEIENQDTSVSIRRSKINENQASNHYRLTIDCKTFSQNPNYLHEALIKVPGQADLDLNVETELKADLDALKAELQSKGWVAGSQLITDYEAWQQQQASMMP